MQVLIVDDSAVMRQLLASSLTTWDYQTIVASNGAEAWERFQQQPVSLVLTDWMMPEVDGLELIRRIRSLPLPHYVYIVLLTGRSEKEDLVEAMEAGADDFVCKPIDHGELRVRMQQGERMIRLERKLADQNERLRQTQAALVQSEKLASLGQLAAGMAHEINNPISFVANNLAVLKRDTSAVMEIVQKYREQQAVLTAAQPAAAQEIEELTNACELPWIVENLPNLFRTSLDGLARVRKIVLNLRSFAHLDEAELAQLNIAEACQSVLEIVNHELKSRRLTVQTDFADERGILCQPSKIKQVIHSVLLNAIQASHEQGVMEIRTREEDTGVVLEIEDHGVGIEPQHLPHIYEPFFTTRPVGQGSGLGLAVSYGIVRDHGGTIEAVSTPGQGSLFRIRLPWQPPLVIQPSAVISTTAARSTVRSS